jgi:hypothetical protein
LVLLVLDVSPKKQARLGLNDMAARRDKAPANSLSFMTCVGNVDEVGSTWDIWKKNLECCGKEENPYEFCSWHINLCARFYEERTLESWVDDLTQFERGCRTYCDELGEQKPEWCPTGLSITAIVSIVVVVVIVVAVGISFAVWYFVCRKKKADDQP